MDLTELYQTLGQRRRPEDVAQLLVPLLQRQLTLLEMVQLRSVATGAVGRSWGPFTSMSEEFARPVGAGRQARQAAHLFDYPLPAPTPVPGTLADFADPAQVEQLLQVLSPQIGKTVDADNYLTDRLDRAARRAAGLEDLSRRRYNKLFRTLRHLSAKRRRLLHALQQRGFQLVSKHGFAHEIPFEEFARDLFSAAFVAYYTARCNLRSEFTIASQERPYDELADLLFRRCGGKGPRQELLGRWRKPAPSATPPATNWWAIAHVYPQPEVLAHLPDQQKGELLGRWTALLNTLASFLRQVWEANTFQRELMVVKRGDDSSTWNVAAGAWNKARDNWINLLYALGMEFVLEEVCPGKVLRLMAGDVAAWHRSIGGTLDPNTLVWATLPLPWAVLDGTADCPAAKVAAACQQAGLNPEKSGWLAPRPHGVVAFRPTPELVHGVSVVSPYLARILRQHRVFSGKVPKN